MNDRLSHVAISTIDRAVPGDYALSTMTAVPSRSLKRALATVALAYALVLQGLLGALAVGTQTMEARHAAQLGVICTVHGMVGADGQTDAKDPTPGKLACIEHCLVGASTILPPPTDTPPSFASWPDIQVTTLRFRADDRDSQRTIAAPPPARGPPALPA